VNVRRVARTALAAPLFVTGGVLVLTLGSANVFAASSTGTSANAATRSSAASNLPQPSSRRHDHDTVECSPGSVPKKHGQCAVTFADPGAGDNNSVGQKVCFSVSPDDAGKVGTGAGHCAFVKSDDEALGSFTTSGRYCGTASIIATESAEHNQTRHTTITIICPPGATTTSAVIPAGGPLPPAGGGWLLGAIGVGVALVAAYAVRTRRWFAPRRLAAGQSA
jgi:hypothetical protein